MKNFLTKLQINNFKSIRSLELDCKRVNVFVGKPNVGKSNILEALTLLSPHYGNLGEKKFMEGQIRYDEISNLFYDDNSSNPILINTDRLSVMVKGLGSHDQYYFVLGKNELVSHFTDIEFKSIAEIKSTFEKEILNLKFQDYAQPLFSVISSNGVYNDLAVNSLEYNPIKPFRYVEGSKYDSRFSNFLVPPFGENLFGVVDQNKELRREIAELFEEFKLDFVLSRKDGKFELQKKIDGIVYKYPYTGIADTFKRLIFYLAAIETNFNSVLVLEEPEVHAFPPYTKELADRITICTENQFFLNTHSPYLLNTLIENLSDDELTVSLVYFEDYNTKLHALTPIEIKEILDFSIDVFFNLDKFVNDGATAEG